MTIHAQVFTWLCLQVSGVCTPRSVPAVTWWELASSAHTSLRAQGGHARSAHASWHTMSPPHLTYPVEPRASQALNKDMGGAPWGQTLLTGRGRRGLQTGLPIHHGGQGVTGNLDRQEAESLNDAGSRRNGRRTSPRIDHSSRELFRRRGQRNEVRGGWGSGIKSILVF